jgi:hypothetical protein
LPAFAKQSKRIQPFQFRVEAMTLLIVLLVVATLVAIAGQLVINKYYWGPKGPPKKGGKG